MRLVEKELDAVMESNAVENKEREIYVLQTILLRQAKRCFTQQNEISVNIELQHAHFLALKSKYLYIDIDIYLILSIYSM